MTDIAITILLIGLGVAAIVRSYRLIRSDGGGPRRSPLPAEPPEGNTILPYPGRTPDGRRRAQSRSSERRGVDVHA